MFQYFTKKKLVSNFHNAFSSVTLFLVVLLSLQILFLNKANAGLISFTPNVGLSNQTTKLTDLSDSLTEIKISNPVYGLKIGVNAMSGISIDAAGTYSSGRAKIINGSLEKENDYTETQAAVQLSVSAMNTFKIYLGYIAQNELAIKGLTQALSYKLKGTGYQAGIAVNMTSSISLGVQYDIHQFNEVNFESVGRYEDTKTYYKKIDSQSTSLNLAISF